VRAPRSFVLLLGEHDTREVHCRRASAKDCGLRRSSVVDLDVAVVPVCWNALAGREVKECDKSSNVLAGGLVAC
jgi:hypothetical protein